LRVARNEPVKLRDRLWKANRRIFVTADTHFGDEAARVKFQRPFPDVEATDDAMIDAINERVGADDALLHLGDFFGRSEWSKSERSDAKRLRARIACRTIMLIRGNLDPDKSDWFDEMFASVDDILAWKGWPDGGALRVVACHYPMRQWQGWPGGALHLYGHVHGTLAEVDRSTDVGVDCWGFRPIELAPLLTMLAARPVATPESWPRGQPIRDAL